MSTKAPATLPKHRLSDEEHKRLGHLRSKRPKPTAPILAQPLTPGQKIADAVASAMGSWNFIIVQSVMLVIWVVLNVIGWKETWDPYPFILLNLALSFQAAYSAPLIMMSQNRQSEIDRARAVDDYDVNVKAELEIELLHQKIDLLREQEIAQLLRIIEELSAKIEKGQSTPPTQAPAQ